MISKKVPVKAATKGKLSRLVNYLLDAKGKGSERVAAVAVTNCRSGDVDPAWAVREMQATQERNQRAKGDKTYHLVVSFRSGEEIAPDALREIEEEFARSLGFTGHQRVSVVHRDTDNLHLHVAINKVHPERFTLHEPFNDYHVREKLCQRLEQRYGLEPDRTRPGRQSPREAPAQEKAATMEAVAGVESLAGFVQRTLREATLGARSWPELHEAFGKTGVRLQARGNGLIVQSGGKTAKASSCFCELSKTALERRLGTFQPPGQLPDFPAPAYEPKPLQRGNTSLYAQYQAGRAEAGSTRTKQLAQALAAHRARVELAKRRYQVHRTTLRAVHGGPLKRVASGLHRGRLKQSVDASYKTFRVEKAAILRAAPLLAWNDWLMQQAARGSQSAAAALRARRSPPPASPSTKPAPPPTPPELPCNHAQPNYSQRNSPRTRRFQRIAALLQSRFGRARPRRAPETLARVRNLSGLDVVFQPERVAVLLHPDAPGRLGAEVSPRPPMRREGAGVAGDGSRSGGGGREGGTMTGTDAGSPYVTRGGTARGNAEAVPRTAETKKDRALER